MNSTKTVRMCRETYLNVHRSSRKENTKKTVCLVRKVRQRSESKPRLAIRGANYPIQVVTRHTLHKSLETKNEQKECKSGTHKILVANSRRLNF